MVFDPIDSRVKNSPIDFNGCFMYLSTGAVEDLLPLIS